MDLATYPRIVQNTYRTYALKHIPFARPVRLLLRSYLLLPNACLFVTSIAHYNSNHTTFDAFNTVKDFRSFTTVYIPGQTKPDLTRVLVGTLTNIRFSRLIHPRHCQSCPNYPHTQSFVHEISPLFFPRSILVKQKSLVHNAEQIYLTPTVTHIIQY